MQTKLAAIWAAVITPLATTAVAYYFGMPLLPWLGYGLLIGGTTAWTTMLAAKKKEAAEATRPPVTKEQRLSDTLPKAPNWTHPRASTYAIPLPDPALLKPIGGGVGVVAALLAVFALTRGVVDYSLLLYVVAVGLVLAFFVAAVDAVRDDF